MDNTILIMLVYTECTPECDKKEIQNNNDLVLSTLKRRQERVIF